MKRKNKVITCVLIVLFLGFGSFIFSYKVREIIFASTTKKISLKDSSNFEDEKQKQISSEETEVDISKDINVKKENTKAVETKDTSTTSNTEVNVVNDNYTKPLKIEVSLDEQKVYVYDKNNTLVRKFTCSSGISGHDTPKGRYGIKERGYSFFSDKYQEGAYYWVQFTGNYLFHSIPFDSNQVIEQNEVKKLGTKASHGCIRLSIENAKWIYNNINKGTLVNIK